MSGMCEVCVLFVCASRCECVRRQYIMCVFVVCFCESVCLSLSGYYKCALCLRVWCAAILLLWCAFVALLPSLVLKIIWTWKILGLKMSI